MPVPGSSSELQELLAKLVAFDTTSAKSNLELIAFLAELAAPTVPFRGKLGLASSLGQTLDRQNLYTGSSTWIVILAKLGQQRAR